MDRNFPPWMSIQSYCGHESTWLSGCSRCSNPCCRLAGRELPLGHASFPKLFQRVRQAPRRCVPIRTERNHSWPGRWRQDRRIFKRDQNLTSLLHGQTARSVPFAFQEWQEILRATCWPVRTIWFPDSQLYFINIQLLPSFHPFKKLFMLILPRWLSPLTCI